MEVETNKPQEQPYPLILINNPKTREFMEERGLDPQKNYTKSDLMEHGFYFYNMVGDGQVSIVKKIENEETGKIPFLTKDQLEQHIKESLPEGLEASELREIENDMNQFIDEVHKLTLIRDRISPDATHTVNDIPRFLGKLEVLHPEWNIQEKARDIELYDWDLRSEIVGDSAKKVQQKYNIPDNVRGIPLSALDRRGEGNNVDNHPCPHMECDHMFTSQDGIRIYDDGSISGEPGQIRMNQITTHLAGHGISNNENSTVDKDHRYMTIKEYLTIYNRKKNDDSQIQELDPKKVNEDLLQIVLSEVSSRLGIKEQLKDEELDEIIKQLTHSQ